MKDGDLVQFVGDVEALLVGLPAEEIQAVREGMKERAFQVAALMVDGTAEIELPLRGDATHFFYVSAVDLILDGGEDDR